MKTSLIERLMSAARQFSAFDFALFKIGLLAVGVLLGSYFHEFFGTCFPIVAILAILCCGYVIYITFRKAYPRKGKKSKKSRR